MEYLIGVMVLAGMSFLLCCLVWIGMALAKSMKKAIVTRAFEKYKHHGKVYVWVRSDLKGLHRDHCLCFDCSKFHPGSPGNCPVAQELYELAVRNETVTPVWECPKFAQDPYAAERKWNFKVTTK
jgi:hypothetical protein